MSRDAGRIVFARAAAFFVMWLAIAGWDPKDALIGAVAATAAASASAALLPRLVRRPRPSAVAMLVFRFLSGSAVAGIDVARRALAPTVDLRPGFLTVPLRLPAGPARDAFLALSSLQPGALPTGAEDGTVIVHAIDRRRPVAASMAADESLFLRAIGSE